MKYFNAELSEIIKAHYDSSIATVLNNNSSLKQKEVSATKIFIEKVLKKYITKETPFITTKEFNHTLATTISVIESNNYDAWQIKQKITNSTTFKDYFKKEDLSKIIGKEKALEYTRAQEISSNVKIIYKNEAGIKKYFGVKK